MTGRGFLAHRGRCRPLRGEIVAGLLLGTLLGIASTLHPQPIEAFTIAFEEEAFDEGPIAQEMAKKAGANFHPFLMSAENACPAYTLTKDFVPPTI